ncbi:hypothetical protein J437_LFUL003246 [Ladona fulva]|uniref:Cytochrome P450 n=1 Tax=Ladona fulva TaxID=123851 RepID=A0A8K0NRD4_LADFU|nr:hypothetical protein J437_LFUL003246 [Ladona fulva]
MAVIPSPRTSMAKGIIALLQQQVQLSKCQQPNCSFHTVKSLNMAETVSAESATTRVRPFHEIPGPKPFPIIGNMWRFFPYIGEYHGMGVLDFHKAVNEKYGDIVRLVGFPGRKAMVFVYRPEEAEITFRNEGPWPIRNGMPSLEYYRKVTRKDFYEDGGGVLTEHGEKWMEARSKANQPMLQPRISKQYIRPIAGVTQDFVDRTRTLRNEKLEMPDDFINELFKWSLESIAYVALDKRLGCLVPNLSADSEPQRIINAVGVFFENLFYLEVGPPIWKLYPTATWKKFVKALDFFIEVSVKYVEEAIRHVQERKEDREPSVLERLLARSDKKSAIIMAQDMIFGGVDTVSNGIFIAINDIFY